MISLATIVTIGAYASLGFVALIVILSVMWHFKRQLPGPPRLPFLGNLLQFQAGKEQIIQLLHDWHKEYAVNGRYEFNLLDKRFVVVSDIKTISKICYQRPSTWRRLDPMDEVISSVGDGVFSAEGERWKRHRKVVHPAFANHNINKMTPQINTVIARLIEKYKAANGEEVPLRANLTASALDVTALVAFGYDLDSLRNPESKANSMIAKVFPYVMGRLTAPVPYYWYLWHTEADRELIKCLPEIDALLADIVQKREASTEPSHDLLADMIRVSQKESSKLSAREFAGNMLQFLLAGQDTTASAMTWTLYYLATHEKELAKVQALADQVLPTASSELSIEDVQSKLGYVTACVKEALRLTGPAPVMFLQANKDVEYDGLKFKAGDAAMTLMHTAMHEPQYFPEPEKFLPTRWPEGGGDGSKSSEEAFNPFGAGSRICPGRKLAMVEAVMFVTRVVRAFDIKLAPGQETPIMQFVFAVQPFPDPLVIFNPRK